jgi:hypothetical protein
MGKLSRTKGLATEREIVNLHKRIGIAAERVPLSGATRYQDNAEDVDVYIEGRDKAPLVSQVKRLATDGGTKMMLSWLGDADALFLRYDAPPGGPARPPIVVLPWASYERLLKSPGKPRESLKLVTTFDAVGIGSAHPAGSQRARGPSRRRT